MIWALWKGSVRVCVLLLMALCIVTGCGSGQAAPPPATATAAPPTATPPPEPTPTPVSMENIVYYESEGNNKRTLSIYHPEAGSPPYPWVLITYTGYVRLEMYASLIKELLSRGYAVAQITKLDLYSFNEDVSCAWAWFEANAGAYGLDSERAVVFSYGAGESSMLGLIDKSVWAERLASCPHPVPSTVHIRGMSFYDAYFVTQGSINDYMDVAWKLLQIEKTQEAAQELVARLTEIPYEEWRTPGRLDESMQRLAAYLPLYYVAGPKPVEEMPAFLLMYSEASDVIPSSESKTMAEVLTKANIPVTLQEIAGARYISIMSGDTPVQIADAIDTFAQGLFADTDN